MKVNMFNLKCMESKKSRHNTYNVLDWFLVCLQAWNHEFYPAPKTDYNEVKSSQVWENVENHESW